MTPEEIGIIIRRQRKALKLTQEEASGLCGVGVTFLSRVERGHDSAEIGKLLRVLRSLGCKVVIERTAF